MKKSIAFVFILAIALMFVGGCAAPQMEQEAPKPVPKQTSTVSSTPAKTETAPVTTTKTEESTTATTTAKEPSKKIKELLGKHVGRVKSMKYMYQDATNKPEEWETWVKGDKMHVKLREMDNIKADVYVDSIYLDGSTRTAKAYCERKVYRCADANSPVDVNYAKYYRKTPLEWIQGVTYAEKLAEEQMQMRNVWKIQYTEGSKTVTMWVDDYYGVPAKVLVEEGSVKNEYVYEDISFNSVDDSDLEHEFVEDAYN